jgi:uncharacterized protein (TIGR00288 family)
MNAPGQLRVALLIDADNAPASEIRVVLTELSKFGAVNVRRAYGNWKKEHLKSWEALLLEHAIRPIQLYDYTKGKNATDIALAIDAMDLLFTDKVEVFGLMSSDCDFTPLAMHLRAKGARVLGFGERKAPAPFVNACTSFLFVGTEPAPAPEMPAKPLDHALNPAKPPAGMPNAVPSASTDAHPPTEVSAPKQTHRWSPEAIQSDGRLVTLLTLGYEAARDESGWAAVGALGSQISNQASFDCRNYGYATLSKLLVASQMFELRDEGKSSVSVRLKRGD